MIYAELNYNQVPEELFKQHPLLRQTLALIKIGHAGQTYNLLPYFHHPIRVMLRLNWHEVSSDILYAALLHDTLEDTEISEGDLESFGYSVRTIQMVKALTRNPDEETYKEYVAKLIETASVDTLRIKLADLYENSNNVRFLPPAKRKVMVRYGKSIDEILAAMRKTSYGISLTEKTISGELDKAELERWIGEQPTFL